MARKRRKMNKAQSERWHFKYAIRERYGLFCNNTMYHQIIRLVHDDTLLLWQSNTREVHKLYVSFDVFDERSIPKVVVEDGKVKIYVVYDSLRSEFCTALPWYETDEELLRELENEHEYVRV